MNIDKQYAWQPAEDCRENVPLLSFLEIYGTGYRKEWMWEDYSDLHSSSSTLLVRL